MDRLPGFRDFYPEPLPSAEAWSADARHYIFTRWRETARRYGFCEYDGPPLEPLELFTTKSGAESSASFTTSRQGRPRRGPAPGNDADARAHDRQRGEELQKTDQVVRHPQLFRYERQQKGRKSEHFQLNADIIGEKDAAADAELIALLIDTLRSFGLTAQDFVIRLSSRNAWRGFYLRRHSDETRAYEFYQVIDKLEREKPEDSAAKALPSSASLSMK